MHSSVESCYIVTPYNKYLKMLEKEMQQVIQTFSLHSQLNYCNIV